MEVEHPRCCGLDVHKKSISACVVIREHGKTEKVERRFGTFTRDLEDMAEWLTQLQVTHLVMEATGVYWKPVWNVLEGRFDLMLVNPQHIKALTGKKCDRRDASHLAELSAARFASRQFHSFCGDSLPARFNKEPYPYGARGGED